MTRWLICRNWGDEEPGQEEGTVALPCYDSQERAERTLQSMIDTGYAQIGEYFIMPIELELEVE